MQTIKGETLGVLEHKINEAKTRLFLLIDYATMSPSEMRLNSSTFSWPIRIATVIRDGQMLIADKTDKFQESLRRRRNQFLEELESYANQVIHCISLAFPVQLVSSHEFVNSLCIKIITVKYPNSN